MQRIGPLEPVYKLFLKKMAAEPSPTQAKIVRGLSNMNIEVPESEDLISILVAAVQGRLRSKKAWHMFLKDNFKYYLFAGSKYCR